MAEKTMEYRETTISFNHTPHHNTMTKSADHFKRISDGFAEFVDNSIQHRGSVQKVDLNISLYLHTKRCMGFAMIADRGAGMNIDELKDYCTFAKPPELRGSGVEAPSGWSNKFHSKLSKFGRGAKHGGFYLGDRITVITKKAGEPVIRELSLSEAEMAERSRLHGSAAAYDNVIKQGREPGKVSSLLENETEFAKLIEDITEHEKQSSQEELGFTMTVISLKEDIVRRLTTDNYKEVQQLRIELAEIYHFYLHPEHLPNRNWKQFADKMKKTMKDDPTNRFFPEHSREDDVLMLDYPTLNLQFKLFVYERPNRCVDLIGAENQPLTALETVMSECITRAQAMFRFDFMMPDPGDPVLDKGNAENNAQATGGKQHRVRGALYYYPSDGTEESLPVVYPTQNKQYLDNSRHNSFVIGKEVRFEIVGEGGDEVDPSHAPQGTQVPATATATALTTALTQASSTPGQPPVAQAGPPLRAVTSFLDVGLFSVFWGSRLVPDVTIKRLPFMKFKMTKQLEKLPTFWEGRIKGFIFLESSFDHIANNKLNITKNNFSAWINDDVAKLLQYEKRRIPQAFPGWLLGCSKLDRDFKLVDRGNATEESGLSRDTQRQSSLFKRLYIGELSIKEGDIIRIAPPHMNRTNSKQNFIFGEVKYFLSSKKHAQGVEFCYDSNAQICFVQAPNHIFFDVQPSCLPVNSIVINDGQVATVDREEIQKLDDHCGKEIAVYIKYGPEDDIQVIEHQDNGFEVLTTDKIDAILVQVLDSQGKHVVQRPHTYSMLKNKYRVVFTYQINNLGFDEIVEFGSSTERNMLTYDPSTKTLIKASKKSTYMSKKALALEYHANQAARFVDAGKGTLTINVFDHDESITGASKRKPILSRAITVVVVPDKAEYYAIDNTFQNMNIRIGDYFPQFTIRLKDKKEATICDLDDSFLVSLHFKTRNNHYKISSAKKGTRADQEGVLLPPDDGFVIAPTLSALEAMREGPPREKFKELLTLEVTVHRLVKDASGKFKKSGETLKPLPGTEDTLKIMLRPGEPKQLVLKTEYDTVINLNEKSVPENLSFECIDAYNHLTYPLENEEWNVRLAKDGGVTANAGALVGADGRAIVSGARLTGIEGEADVPVEGKQIDQGFYLEIAETVRSEKGEEVNERTIESQSPCRMEFTVEAASRATDLRVTRGNGLPLINESVPVNSLVSDLFFEILDHRGNVMNFDPDFYFPRLERKESTRLAKSGKRLGLHCSWAEDEDTTPTVTNLPNLRAPSSAGDHSFYVYLQIYTFGEPSTLMAHFTVTATPGEGKKWIIVTKQPPKEILCGDPRSLQHLFNGICLTDEYDNVVDVQKDTERPALSVRTVSAPSLADDDDEDDDDDDNPDPNPNQEDEDDDDGSPGGSGDEQNSDELSILGKDVKKRNRSKKHVLLPTAGKRQRREDVTKEADASIQSAALTLVEGAVSHTAPGGHGKSKGSHESVGFLLSEDASVDFTGLSEKPQKIVFEIQQSEKYQGCTLESILTGGMPAKLALSAPSLQAMSMSDCQDINVSRFQKVDDIRFHLLDKFGNPACMKNRQNIELMIKHPENGQKLVKYKCGKSYFTDLSLDFSFEMPRPRQREEGDADTDGLIVMDMVCSAVYKKKEPSLSEIAPATLRCHVATLDVVNTLNLKLMNPDGDIIEPSHGNSITVAYDDPLPRLYIECVTDNNALYSPPPESLAIKVEYQAEVVSSKSVIKEATFFASKEVSRDGKGVVFVVNPDFPTDASIPKAGRFTMEVTYFERRESLDVLPDSAKRTTASISMQINVGDLAYLEFAKEHAKRFENAVASNSVSCNAKDRVIASNIQVFAYDKDRNRCVFPEHCELQCTLERAEPTLAHPEPVNNPAPPLLVSSRNGPFLFAEMSSNRKTATFKKLELRPGVGGSDGPIAVVFSLMQTIRSLSASQNNICEDLIASFILSTDEGKLLKAQEIREERDRVDQELLEFRGRDDELQRQLRDVKVCIQDALNESRTGRLAFVEPSQMSQSLNDIERALNENQLTMRLQASQYRRQKKAEELPGYVLAGIKGQVGLVVDLGFVNDEKDARILSWAASYRMSMFVVETSNEKIKLYRKQESLKVPEAQRVSIMDLQVCKMYRFRDAGGTMRERNQNERDEGRLPMHSFVSKQGNPEYLVNKILLLPEQEHLRDTLFFSIYSTQILVDTMRDANKYLQECRARKLNPPSTIYTREGEKVTGDGMVDPRARNKLPSADNMKYIYGDLPPQSTSEFSDIEHDLGAIGALKNLAMRQSELQEDLRQLNNRREYIQGLQKERRQLTARLEALGVQDETENVQAPLRKRNKR